MSLSLSLSRALTNETERKEIPRKTHSTQSYRTTNRVPIHRHRWGWSIRKSCLRLQNQIFVTCPIGCHTLSLWTFLVHTFFLFFSWYATDQQISNYANSQQIVRARETSKNEIDSNSRATKFINGDVIWIWIILHFLLDVFTCVFRLMALQWATFHNLLNLFSACEPFRILTNVQRFFFVHLILFALAERVRLCANVFLGMLIPDFDETGMPYFFSVTFGVIHLWRWRLYWYAIKYVL